MDMDKKLQECIAEAERIAREGTIKEQEDFVEWACNMLRFASALGNEKGVAIVEAQYMAYLRVKGGTKQ